MIDNINEDGHGIPISHTEDTSITIKVKGDEVVCKINGEEEDLINALSTLMLDEVKDRNNFRFLMEEAISLVMFEKYNKMQGEQTYCEHHHPKEDNLPN